MLVDDSWKESVQTAKSFHLTELLRQTLSFFKKQYSSSSTSPLSLFSSVFLVRSVSYPVGALWFCQLSGYGAVSSTCPASALLLSTQMELLTLVFALPQPRSLEDLLHKLLKGTLDAVFGLCTGLCTKQSRKIHDIRKTFEQQVARTNRNGSF